MPDPHTLKDEQLRMLTEGERVIAERAKEYGRDCDRCNGDGTVWVAPGAYSINGHWAKCSVCALFRFNIPALLRTVVEMRMKLEPRGDDALPVSFAALMDNVRHHCPGHTSDAVEELLFYHIRRADKADRTVAGLREAALAVLTEFDWLVKVGKVKNYEVIRNNLRTALAAPSPATRAGEGVDR
jgi:hypothetical protein